MSRGRPDLMARVPTLTEVAEPGSGGSSAGRGTPALFGPARSQEAARWVDDVMDGVAPQVSALLNSQLREVLTPAVQEAVHAAVEDAIDRFREPLMEALMIRLRDAVEQEVARRATESRPNRP